MSRKIRRSYKSKLSKLIQNLNKLKAQSLSKGKKIPQDILIAEQRLKDYLNVLSQLHNLGYRVKQGGEVVPLESKEKQCRECGCTDSDCRQCIERTGESSR